MASESIWKVTHVDFFLRRILISGGLYREIQGVQIESFEDSLEIAKVIASQMGVQEIKIPSGFISRKHKITRGNYPTSDTRLRKEPNTDVKIAKADLKRNKQAATAVVIGEVIAIKEKAQRYIDGNSTRDELSASTPMLTSIASDLGYLSKEQIIAYRRAVTLDMEMRKTGDRNKVLTTIEACDEVLRILEKV
ncbi:hypothetical protein ACFLVX_01575 [Chloroflexota bacterium]